MTVDNEFQPTARVEQSGDSVYSKRVRTKSINVKITQKLEKNVVNFGKLPVDSVAINSKQQHKQYRVKTMVFLMLDVLLLIALCLAIVGASQHECKDNCDKTVLPPVTVMFVLVFISFIVDWLVYRQIQQLFINRRLAFFSLFLDFTMFCVGVWELTAVIRIETKSNTYALIFSVILLLVTFLRVSNIMAGLLFVICCLPFYCLPEWCPCHQWLTKDDMSEEILNKLEEHQWIYQEAYMIDKT